MIHPVKSQLVRAAVLGAPISHSLSPVLHGAAYLALGLRDWTYDRIECDAAALPHIVSSSGPEWVGFSVTMPGKFAALEVADWVTQRATQIGSANTLVRTAHGWKADNTDIDGVVGALAEMSVPREIDRVVILGAGGTALPALAALADQYSPQIVTVVARDRSRAQVAFDCAERVGLDVRFAQLESLLAEQSLQSADLVISTLPGSAADVCAPKLRDAGYVLDVVYHPWPTLIASIVQQAGGRVASGTRMLLHQAFTQVELFTGCTAPRTEMEQALACALR